jgi:uncharacterized protein YbaR (Trm112 family)
MYLGFPAGMMSLVRCPGDDGTLAIEEILKQQYGRYWQASLTCTSCGQRYHVIDGILHMLDDVALNAESETERRARDDIASQADVTWEQTDWSRMEVEPMMEASEPLANTLVLELGAGAGRCTVEMARRGASVLACDFSLASLHTLARRCEPAWEIGLVWADCTQFSVRPSAFPLVACTLMSNLPDQQQRTQLMRIAAKACDPSGKFVFGTHHYGVQSLLRRELRSGYYAGAPIYRYLFRAREIKRETRRHFGFVSCHPIVITIPFLRRLGVPTVKVSRLSERVPGVNQLGHLLLVVAKKPRKADMYHVSETDYAVGFTRRPRSNV